MFNKDVKRAANIFQKAQERWGLSTSDMVRGIAYWYEAATSPYPTTKRIHDALIAVAELIERGGTEV